MISSGRSQVISGMLCYCKVATWCSSLTHFYWWNFALLHPICSPSVESNITVFCLNKDQYLQFELFLSSVENNTRVSYSPQDKSDCLLGTLSNCQHSSLGISWLFIYVWCCMAGCTIRTSYDILFLWRKMPGYKEVEWKATYVTFVLWLYRGPPGPLGWWDFGHQVTTLLLVLKKWTST